MKHDTSYLGLSCHGVLTPEKCAFPDHGDDPNSSVVVRVCQSSGSTATISLVYQAFAACYCQRHIGRYTHRSAACLVPETPMALQTLFHISVLLLMCTAKAINPEAEALLRWKSALVRATSLSSWSMANSTCSWFGVRCDAAGHVSEIHLPNTRLHGTLHSFYSTLLQLSRTSPRSN